MALTILDANFTQNGVTLGTNNVYIDVMFIAPHGVENLQTRLKVYDYTGNQIGGELLKVDDINNFNFPATDIISSDFWGDINAGAVHDKIIELLEIAQPTWSGKITKVIPS